MEIAELIEQLERRGAILTVDGDRVRLRAPTAPSAKLLERLRLEKQAIICYLKARRAPCVPPDDSQWPEASQDATRRLAQPHARLFPLVGLKVRTPEGPGTLLQVFADRVTVLLDRELSKCSFFLPSEIEPVSKVWPR